MNTQEKNTVIELLNAIRAFDEYREHDVHCEITYCDVCTCGLAPTRNWLRKAYNECLNLVTS